MSGLFDCKPPLDCLTTLEHIVWASPPCWPDAYVGPTPFLPIVNLLQNFAPESALKSLTLTVRFEDLPMDRARTLAVWRALPDTLTKERFPFFERVYICAQVESNSGRSVQVERMSTDLRYVAQELQSMGYPFVLEVKVEEWYEVLEDPDL